MGGHHVVSVERHSERVLILKMVLDNSLLNVLTFNASHSGKLRTKNRVFGTNRYIW